MPTTAHPGGPNALIGFGCSNPAPVPALADPASRPLRRHFYERVLRQFGTWHYLAKMRQDDHQRPTANAFTYASMAKHTIQLRTWLDNTTRA